MSNISELYVHDSDDENDEDRGRWRRIYRVGYQMLTSGTLIKMCGSGISWFRVTYKKSYGLLKSYTTYLAMHIYLHRDQKYFENVWDDFAFAFFVKTGHVPKSELIVNARKDLLKKIQSK